MQDFSIILTIENYPDLLTEYGRSFAYINNVERLLESFMQTKIPDEKNRKEIVSLMLGKKIGIIVKNKWLSNTIIDELNTLNEMRRVLAHGIIAESVFGKNNINTGEFIIHHKGVRTFDTDYLSQVVQKSKKIISELYENIASTAIKSVK